MAKKDFMNSGQQAASRFFSNDEVIQEQQTASSPEKIDEPELKEIISVKNDEAELKKGETIKKPIFTTKQKTKKKAKTYYLSEEDIEYVIKIKDENGVETESAVIEQMIDYFRKEM